VLLDALAPGAYGHLCREEQSAVEVLVVGAGRRQVLLDLSDEVIGLLADVRRRVVGVLDYEPEFAVGDLAVRGI
jgi:hypothetical protein